MSWHKLLIIKDLQHYIFRRWNVCLALAAVLCLLPTACSDAPTGTNQRAQRVWNSLWIPLANGNAWEYDALEEVSQSPGERTQQMQHGGAMPDRILFWSDREQDYLPAGESTTFAILEGEFALGLDLCFVDGEFGRGLAIGARPASAIDNPRRYIGILPLDTFTDPLVFGPAPLNEGGSLLIRVNHDEATYNTERGAVATLRFECIYRNSDNVITDRVERLAALGVGIVEMTRQHFRDGQLESEWRYDLSDYSIY